MTVVIYDGTFQGLLTAIFEVFYHKFINVDIYKQGCYTATMFGNTHTAMTDQVKASRVWRGLSQKISQRALSNLYKTFLSEQKGIENTLLKYIRYVLDSKGTVENNYANEAVLAINQTGRKVDREKHRMEAFIRFQLAKEGLYYATCQPDFDVLPLITKHFKDRFADQQWLIYDLTRKYGIYYNLKTVETVQLTFAPEVNGGKNIEMFVDENEMLYQQLWQQYFNSVNIPARKNMKLHVQHMPKRYWHILPEKQPTKFK